MGDPESYVHIYVSPEIGDDEARELTENKTDWCHKLIANLIKRANPNWHPQKRNILF